MGRLIIPPRFSGGRGVSKSDGSGLDLYLPLWRPDMVAVGGSIVNGTGTMDVNPQSLSVGANTITVTAAGTFVVSIPEGGTVASGTMTVTGSPVTVSAGIPATITTTGAIGTITVTPSNIIRSKDSNRYACTITGAAWNYQGRVLDGTDDTVQISNPTFLDSTSGAILMWAKFSSTTTAQALCGASVNGQTDDELQWIYRGQDLQSFDFTTFTNGGVGEVSLRSNGTITDTNWHSFALSSSGSTNSMFIDETQQTLSVISGSNNGAWFAAATQADIFSIGGIQRGTLIADMAGTVGEIRIQSTFSFADYLRWRQETKWRYQ